MREDQKRADATRTLSVRLPAREAGAVRTAAAAQHISISTYIADALRGRSRPVYPALAALGEIIALAHALRDDPANVAAVTALQDMIAELHSLVRSEIAW